MELETIEQSLLEQLAASKGNLLENTELLGSLNAAKQNAETVSASLKESATLQASLAEERSAYNALADAASRLYFALTDLHHMNHVYRFSLNGMLKLFKRALKHVSGIL